MRNDVLRVLHDSAVAVAPAAVDDDLLAELLESRRKLEVVIGRLWGTVGDLALECLLALRLAIPNAAHLLAAVHLARGGVHVTVNLDVGIELAYRHLVDDHSSDRLPPAFREAIQGWRRLLPREPVVLRVVASHEEFAAWLAAGKPAALLKIHGSLSEDQARLVDPVAVDVLELGQLTPARAAAVDLLGECDRLLVAGYAGEDIDVYRPLLASIGRTRTVWCQIGGDDSSPVPDDLRQRGAALLTGVESGAASSGLATALGLNGVPAWPEDAEAEEPYETRFAEWATRLTITNRAEDLAAAYAWLLADLGNYDQASMILTEVGQRHSGAGADFRRADVLYHRGHAGDRARAAQMFLHVVLSRRASWSTRLHSLLRMGDCGRSLTRRYWLAFPLAILPALVVLVVTIGGRSQPEMAADAYRALQQLGLRTIERLAAQLPAWTRPGLAQACRLAGRCGALGLRLTANGNRQALMTQHRLTLLILVDLLTSRQPSVSTATDLMSLRNSYRNGDDPAGAGNCTVSLALHAAASGQYATAIAELREARMLYGQSRPKGTPNPTGTAFADVAERVIRAVVHSRQRL